MVQIKNKDFWKYDENRAGTSIEDIKNVENKLDIKFSKKYVELMIEHNGGRVKKNIFEYFDKYENKIFEGNIYLLPLNRPDFSLLETYSDPPEFFPEGLVPFADDGGGNLTCFDYRKTKENPSIVFWVHDDPEGEDVHFVANNFDDFVAMLRKPEY